MKREYVLYCKLDTGDEVFVPVPIVVESDLIPFVGIEEINKRRLWEGFLTLETAIETRFPEEMQRRLPPELRGKVI